MSKNKIIKFLFFTFTFVTTSSANNNLFNDPVFYNSGNGPIQSAAADFNNDGYPDLAVLNYTDGSVSIFLNNGYGTFGEQNIYSVMTHPYAFTVSDFNNDSFPDIVATCSEANVISYLENNGDGTFKPRINSPTQQFPFGLDAYDFNSDLYTDIAVINRHSETFQILTNNHDGTFTPTFSAYTGAGPGFLTIGNLDGDRFPEIAVTRSYDYLWFTISALTIFRNNHDGTFTQYFNYEYGATCSNIYLYDFNGDSYNDIITNTFRENTEEMCFFINDGWGNFGEPVTAYCSYEGRFTMADFDNNGLMDFAIPEYQYNATGVAVILNNGNFNFEPSIIIGVGEQPRHPANADFDLDGDPDVAFPLYYEAKVAVLINKTNVIPVELTAFYANIKDNDVTLSWTTASERNNSGFEIQRKVNNSIPGSEAKSWIEAGFVKGHGTTTEENNYSFMDKNLRPGGYSYRLVQIDFDGTKTESNIIDVEINSQPTQYSLKQNYPNPFNPTTIIEYSIPYEGNVKIIIYNSLGQEVQTPVNNYTQAGNYRVNFDATTLPSGIYYYRLNADNYSSVKKMILLK